MFNARWRTWKRSTSHENPPLPHHGMLDPAGTPIPLEHVAEVCKHVKLQPGPSAPFEFVSVTVDPRARIFKHCPDCGADFPDAHPDNGCLMTDVYNTDEC